MADTSSLPLFQDVKHSPTAGHASPVFNTSVFQKTSDASPLKTDNVEKTDQEPISASSAATNEIANGGTNGTTAEATAAPDSIPDPLPLTEEPVTEPVAAPATSEAADPVLDGAAVTANTGEKRKAEDVKEDEPKPAPDAAADKDGGKPAAKKAKTDAEAVSNGDNAPAAEVGLASAPAPAEKSDELLDEKLAEPTTTKANGESAGTKKNTKRTKREKKEPAVGRAARKTRSQGPVDA